jgi:glutamate-1-semialdehyde 2,1-aminomutase
MEAIKVARAFTGRDRILKMDGAYHGSYEGIEFNLASPAGDAREDRRLSPTAGGIPRNEADNLLVAPFDDPEAALRLIVANQRDLAAVVVNPVLTRGGLTVPSLGYLAFLREVTRERDVLLIFDEVITLRIAMGGAQEFYDVMPDLTAMGKIIGGGLPVGAFGGRADVMKLFADNDWPTVPHAGTFNGNPLTMAGGIASLELLTPAAYQRLAAMGRLLRDRLEATVVEAGVALEVTAIASLVSLTMRPTIVGDPAALSEILRLVFLALLNRGIKASPIFGVSTVLIEAEIDRLADTLREVLMDLRPAIDAEVPGLAGRTRRSP